MKKIIFFLCFIVPVIAFGQRVKVSTDDFTGEKTIETSWEKIYSGGMTGKHQTRIKLEDTDGRQYISFRIYTDSPASIVGDAEVLFKTSEGIVKGTVIKFATASPGAWMLNAPNNKLGILFSIRIDLSQLKGTIEKIRIPLLDGNLDLDISKKDSDKIHKMINLVIAN